jgi:hypothetical protein
MALGRQGAVQEALLIGWQEVPTASGSMASGLEIRRAATRQLECQPITLRS